MAAWGEDCSLVGWRWGIPKIVSWGKWGVPSPPILSSPAAASPPQPHPVGSHRAGASAYSHTEQEGGGLRGQEGHRMKRTASNMTHGFLIHSSGEAGHHFGENKHVQPRGFPGGPVVRIPPCSAGDTTSLIPGLGRSYLLQGNYACATTSESALCSPWATVAEPTCSNFGSPWTLEPVLHNERSPQWEARLPQLHSTPALRNYKKPACSNKHPAQPKRN